MNGEQIIGHSRLGAMGKHSSSNAVDNYQKKSNKLKGAQLRETYSKEKHLSHIKRDSQDKNLDLGQYASNSDFNSGRKSLAAKKLSNSREHTQNTLDDTHKRILGNTNRENTKSSILFSDMEGDADVDFSNVQVN